MVNYSEEDDSFDWFVFLYIKRQKALYIKAKQSPEVPKSINPINAPFIIPTGVGSNPMYTLDHISRKGVAYPNKYEAMPITTKVSDHKMPKLSAKGISLICIINTPIYFVLRLQQPGRDFQI